LTTSDPVPEWADGTRSSLARRHPSVIIGNRSSIMVGQGVFVGQGKGLVHCAQ